MGGKGSGRKSLYSAPQPRKTNYSMAWGKFSTTSEYGRLYRALLERGMHQPFIDNVLRGAFEAGWNATGTKIEIVDIPPKT